MTQEKLDSLSPSEPTKSCNCACWRCTTTKGHCVRCDHNPERKCMKQSKSNNALAKGSPSEEGTGWISVEQELPVPGLNVLAIRVGSYSTSQHYTVYRTEPLTEDKMWTWRDNHSGCQEMWFSHWQPLPAPPVAPPEKEVKK
jgi:hypothetical protein